MTTYVELAVLFLILIALLVCMVLLIFLLTRRPKPAKSDNSPLLNEISNKINDSNRALRQELTSSIQSSVRNLGDMVSSNQKAFSEAQNQHLADMDRSISEKQEKMSKSIGEQVRQFENSITEKQTLMNRNVQEQMKEIENSITTTQKNAAEAQNKRLDDMDKSINEKQALMNENVQNQMKQLEERFKTLETTNEQKLNAMRETISQQLMLIQNDNNKKLDEMRQTVDDKLQKTLDEKMASNFKLVSERLEQVHKGLGEMQSIASSVGDLKKVLSNVKTRGILGEIQLSAILSEILTPEQYETEIATVPGSRDHVEFAIRLPGKEDGGFIYLPIDSKFPGDTYAMLQDAYESGDPEAIRDAKKNLKNVIKNCARDIRDKYIFPPNTTNFAIMFLPFEGLYAEVVNNGLVEELQRDYNVNIAGPSTMAAMLNSLQMGFKTLQIQKRSSEVWDVLSAVKTEFEKFEDVFKSAQKRIRQLDEDMDKLVGTRTRAIQRKLNTVQTMDSAEAQSLLEISYDDLNNRNEDIEE